MSKKMKCMRRDTRNWVHGLTGSEIVGKKKRKKNKAGGVFFCFLFFFLRFPGYLNPINQHLLENQFLYVFPKKGLRGSTEAGIEFWGSRLGCESQSTRACTCGKG